MLCLGYKELGALSHQQVRDLTRDECEQGLTFVGFVIISCPFKPDTKAVVREILSSSHHITMITGDNPLTACHVAAQLKLIDKKSTFVLSRRAKSDDDWYWSSIVDEAVQRPLEFALEKKSLASTPKPTSKVHEAIIASGASNFFCLTGEVF